MPTRRSKRTLRGMPPVATELAKLGNVLQSAKLIALADKVARLEHKAEALDEHHMVRLSERFTDDERSE